MGRMLLIVGVMIVTLTAIGACDANTSQTSNWCHDGDKITHYWNGGDFWMFLEPNAPECA